MSHLPLVFIPIGNILNLQKKKKKSFREVIPYFLFYKYGFKIFNILRHCQVEYLLSFFVKYFNIKSPITFYP